MEEQQAAAPATLLPFELGRGGDEKLSTADLCNSEITLLYLYSTAKRDPAAEKSLAEAAKANPGKVRVVPVRNAGSTGAVPAEIAKLGTPVTDTSGAVFKGYRVKALPAVVVLKNRPVYHGVFAGETAVSEQLEMAVDGLVDRDDLVPPEMGGCGGDCGGGGGMCAAGAAMAAQGPACAAP